MKTRAAQLVSIVVVAALSTAACTDARRVARPTTRRPTRGPAIVWTHATIGWVGGVAADAHDVVAISGNHHVSLLDANTGAPRWDVEVAGIENSPPVLTPDAVVVATATGFAVLQRDDGSPRWKHDGADAPGAISGNDGAFAFAADDGVIAVWPVTALGQAEAVPPRWQARFGGAVGAAPAVTADHVIAAWHDDAGATVRSFAVSDGALQWTLTLTEGSSAPALFGDLVVIGDGGGHRLLGLAAESGEVHWSVAMPAGFESAQRAALVATIRGTLVVAADHFGNVVAVDGRSGVVRWSAVTGDRDAIGQGQPVVAAASVVVASEIAGVSRFALATGERLPTPPTRGLVARLAVGGGRLVVGFRLSTPGRVEAWGP